MPMRARKFSLIIFIALYSTIFCSKVVKSEGSSTNGLGLGLQEGIEFGRPDAIDFTSGPWMRGLKQILPVLATGPVAVDANTTDSKSNDSLILAEIRTRRPDILHKFKRYSGGWNITNKHYWASVGFTGAPGFILALLWFTVFGLALYILCCCRQRIKGEQQGLLPSYWISLLLLIVFTFAAVVGCSLLSLGQDKFHREISDTLKFVVKQSDVVVDNLRNVTEYLADAKTISVAQTVIPEDERNQIEKLNENLIRAADELEGITTDSADKMQKALDIVRDALIVVAGVMILLAVLGLLLAVLGFRHIIYILVVIGWLLVVGTFILCGVFTVLNNAITDACVAMQEWVDHPNADTTLDGMLPCVDKSTTNQTLYKSKEVTSDLVNVTNQVITNVANGGTAYYNQTGPQMPQLCNPYDYMLNDRQCLPEEVNFTNAAQVWQNYVCTVSNGMCVTQGRVTPNISAQLVTAVNLSYGLQHYTPFLLNLTDCTFVRETFTTIRQSYCPELQLHVKWVYIGLALVSVGVMLSLIFWIIYTRQTDHKVEYLKPITT